MEIQDLAQRFGDTRENCTKAVFSTLFIAGNRLQTLFDNGSPEVSLKQFMLLTMVRQSQEQLTFTQLGRLLGCSRQNIKKLAFALEKNGFVTLAQSEKDPRASAILPTEKLHGYFEAMAAEHEKKLKSIFGLYSDEEMATLFRLMMKLYDCLSQAEENAEAGRHNTSAAAMEGTDE